MTTKKQVLKLLRNNRSYLASEFNVKKIGIFGSYAKGSPGDSSDIDIIVEFNGPVGFKFMELTEYLESLYTEGMTYPIFLADTKTQDAVISNIATEKILSEENDGWYLNVGLEVFQLVHGTVLW